MVWVLPLRSRQPAVLAENGVELDSLRSESLALIRFRLRSSAQPDGWSTGSTSFWLVIPDLIRDPSFASSCLEVCLHLLAGGCPAASNFLLLRQKKVTKEKATLLSASLRFAAGNLRCSVQPGSSSNSLRSDNRSPCSVWTSAPRRIQKGGERKTNAGTKSGAEEARSASSAGIPSGRHVCTREQRTRPNEVPLHRPAGRGRG
jgi:hypothetical protein